MKFLTINSKAQKGHIFESAQQEKFSLEFLNHFWKEFYYVM